MPGSLPGNYNEQRRHAHRFYVEISRTRSGVRAGPGLMRTTLCLNIAGCFLTWETSQPFLTALGRNPYNIDIELMMVMVVLIVVVMVDGIYNG